MAGVAPAAEGAASLADPAFIDLGVRFGRSLALAQMRGDRGECGRRHPLDAGGCAKRWRAGAVPDAADLIRQAADLVEPDVAEGRVVLALSQPQFRLLAMEVAGVA